MKKYVVYNQTLDMYSPKGHVNSVANAGYGGRWDIDKAKAKFWSKKPSHYSRLQDAKRQLRYCIEQFGDEYILYIIEYNLQESNRYMIVDDELVPATQTAKLLYR